ncbi:NrsF family protein [Aurantiacibacter sediminis]|uniref:DUF1109 domain-containing protein n=1 Tax=Aurantiacibacter sediminis TaxID=2793064 RepID=A0ABS0N363_9SPHN|nr:DUF1109 domain-containing protein [Aurantiacibacter sediminis]MBH5322408.1 DUF1109 domain-containing protein [Aurantiacibacter sediminis]
MTDTQSLIDQLAQDPARPVGSPVVPFALPVIAIMALCGMGVALVFSEPFLSVDLYGWGPMLVKWGFSIALLLLCVPALWILGKPGRRSRWAVAALALPFIPVAALLIFEMAISGLLVAGETWANCLTAMAVMSPIAFAGAILAMRTLAPTHLNRAGLVAGLFGGAVAMTAYAPFCPEIGMGYMAVFYCLPIFAMAAIGWFSGPRLLRW